MPVQDCDTEALRRALRDAPAPPGAEGRIVEGALQRMGRGRGVWAMRAALAVVAAAAVVLVVLWIAALRDGSGSRHGGPGAGKQQQVATHRGSDPVVGTVWVAAAEERACPLGPHRVDLSPRARLRFAAGTPAAPRLELGQGRARFAVAPLAGTGQSFTVQTRQVHVTVLGTSFSVDVRERCTRVEVSSGRVRATPARGEPRELGRGEQRSFCDAEELDAAGRQVQRAISLSRKGESLAEAEAALAAYLDSQPRGTYAEEAHYFLVLVKRRLGKEHEAVAQARTFLERFPSTARAATLRVWLEKKNP